MYEGSLKSIEYWPTLVSNQEKKKPCNINYLLTCAYKINKKSTIPRIFSNFGLHYPYEVKISYLMWERLISKTVTWLTYSTYLQSFISLGAWQPLILVFKFFFPYCSLLLIVQLSRNPWKDEFTQKWKVGLEEHFWSFTVKPCYSILFNNWWNWGLALAKQTTKKYKIAQ